MGTNQLDREQALKFTRAMLALYYGQRNMEQLTDNMRADVSWVGTGENEFCTDLTEARVALAGQKTESGGGFTVTEESLHFVPLSCGGVVYGTICAVPLNTELAVENVRFSAVLDQTADGIRLAHMHFSHPDSEQSQGEYFVKQAARTEKQTLNQELERRKWQLERLNRNIPGGAHQCKNDPDFTLVSVSDSFLDMFGYTEEEISTLFHNHFIEMVYSSDRDALRRSAREQVKKGGETELEYRVVCKDGTPVWVYDRGRLLLDEDTGEESFFSLLIENTARKREQEELRLSLERHRIIMDQANEIIFEWDIRADTLIFSANWHKKFGYQAISQEISGRIPLSKNIHPEDMSVFLKIMRDVGAGAPYSEVEFRIRDAEGKYHWCRIRATAQFDAEGRAIKAVGVIIDIDSEKTRTQALVEMAQRDTLTGLYNKATINSLVEHWMCAQKGSGLQAFFIVDVDHFKSVNDTYGHLTGDSVLSDVAAVIKSGLREDEIAGRIGGDEFMVYLESVTTKEEAMERAEQMRASLALLVPETGAPPITCSIGVTAVPYGERDFQSFYKCADLALYACKSSGRGGVRLYREGMEQMPGGVMQAATTAVDSDMGRVADLQLSQYVFRTLYAAQDLRKSIGQVLEIVGRSYDVSRAYIFENSPDGKTCSNTFEWCAKDIQPQLARLQKLSYADDLHCYQKNFEPDGIFLCADRSEAPPVLRAEMEKQGIRSIVQCAMLDEGKLVGYIGFNECRENRKWSHKLIDSFQLTADVLSVFLMKLRQKQKLLMAQDSGLNTAETPERADGCC